MSMDLRPEYLSIASSQEVRLTVPSSQFFLQMDLLFLPDLSDSVTMSICSKEPNFICHIPDVDLNQELLFLWTLVAKWQVWL